MPSGCGKWGVATYDPSIVKHVTEESLLKERRSKLIAGGKVMFAGKEVKLLDLSPYMQSRDRTVRHDATAAYWSLFEANQDELNEILDRLVKVRDSMATTLPGRNNKKYKNYTELGYDLNSRIGYDAADVAAYREDAAKYIIPTIGRILDQRKNELGLDHLYVWDSGLTDPQGNPKPVGGYNELMTGMETMLSQMDPDFVQLFRL